MAFLTIPNVRPVGLACAVPKQVKVIKTLDCFVSETEAEKTIQLTGVKECRIAPEDKVCSDYCYEAAERLIAELGWEKDTIDCLVYVSVSRDYIEPNTATVIQGRLDLPKTCYTIDVPMACSGYCYGLSTVAALLSLSCMKRALLLVGDTPSKILSPLDKTMWGIHGDAGSATALEYDPTAKPIKFNLMSDGKSCNAIIAPATGVRERVTEDSLKMVEIEPGIVMNRTHVRMDGMAVFSFTISQVPKCIKALCEEFNIDLQNDVDYLLLHQANKYIDDKIRQKLKMPAEKVPYCLETYGNTSSGTIPMTIVTEIRDQIEAGNKKLVMCGFGAGLSWAAVYMEVENMKVLPLIEID